MYPLPPPTTLASPNVYRRHVETHGASPHAQIISKKGHHSLTPVQTNAYLAGTQGYGYAYPLPAHHGHILYGQPHIQAPHSHVHGSGSHGYTHGQAQSSPYAYAYARQARHTQSSARPTATGPLGRIPGKTSLPPGIHLGSIGAISGVPPALEGEEQINEAAAGGEGVAFAQDVKPDIPWNGGRRHSEGDLVLEGQFGNVVAERGMEASGANASGGDSERKR